MTSCKFLIFCFHINLQPRDYIQIWVPTNPGGAKRLALSTIESESDFYLWVCLMRYMNAGEEAWIGNISAWFLEPNGGFTWQMTNKRDDSEVHNLSSIETEEIRCTDPHLPPCAAYVFNLLKSWHLCFLETHSANDLVHDWGLDFALQKCIDVSYHLEKGTFPLLELEAASSFLPFACYGGRIGYRHVWIGLRVVYVLTALKTNLIEKVSWFGIRLLVSTLSNGKISYRVVVGVSQRISFSACTEFPCFEPSPQAQTLLHCLLRHLFQHDEIALFVLLRFLSSKEFPLVFLIYMFAKGTRISDYCLTGQVNLVEQERLPLEEVFEQLRTSQGGLTSEDAEENKILKFLSVMWNPLSWAMEAAAMMAIVLANGGGQGPDWQDFIGIVACKINSTISFFEENNASNAAASLMARLVQKTKVLRDGSWLEQDAAVLVPGDIISIKLEDIIPADARLLEGDSLRIDQAIYFFEELINALHMFFFGILGLIVLSDLALTGESVPVTKRTGDEVFSGSTCKHGEIEAVVIATGHSLFGKAAHLVDSTEVVGHFQQTLPLESCLIHVNSETLAPTAFLLNVYKSSSSTQGLCSCFHWEFLHLFNSYGDASGNPCYVPYTTSFIQRYRDGINNLLVLLIGGIPITMPTVLSVTLAIGSHRLSQQVQLSIATELSQPRIFIAELIATPLFSFLLFPIIFFLFLKGAITKRMTAIEEMAGMDVLCSDKTGTLTLNRLTVDRNFIEVFHKDMDKDMVVLLAVRAARLENQDAIDTAIVSMLVDPKEKEQIAGKVHAIIDKFAEHGLRSLGVAIQEVPEKSKKSLGGAWKFYGLLPLFDPPRHDSAETIRKALHLGVCVKMIACDKYSSAILKWLCSSESLFSVICLINIAHLQVAFKWRIEPILLVAFEKRGTQTMKKIIKLFHVLKQVISCQLQRRQVDDLAWELICTPPHHCWAVKGMELKPFRWMSSSKRQMALRVYFLVFTSAMFAYLQSRPLSTIPIFSLNDITEGLLMNMQIYVVSITIWIVLGFTLLALIWEFDFPPFMVLIIAKLNDGTIMTISQDRVKPSPGPDSWKLNEIFATSIVIGTYLALVTVLFYWVAEGTSFFEVT
ncbi:hypothetical protein RHSIM_Rhsim06G0128400 [Rhododendron simsii]|uniref:Cation-transporting P-type ATPase N-terminal domain-containing protein n=1 Tax=Rhododendron simsii TaxID=118357 RepID=A0A834LMQ3_RHOSS|nr:hypothetical protein RHSIM_Rhsim06G0128400 [Rhododendron simsii]